MVFGEMEGSLSKGNDENVLKIVDKRQTRLSRKEA
jgi:hypothetical protein